LSDFSAFSPWPLLGARAILHFGYARNHVATTPTNEQGKPMGHVYVDVTLTNLFSRKSVNVCALVDTGAFRTPL
jgi:hypothetical protein